MCTSFLNDESQPNNMGHIFLCNYCGLCSISSQEIHGTNRGPFSVHVKLITSFDLVCHGLLARQPTHAANYPVQGSTVNFTSQAKLCPNHDWKKLSSHLAMTTDGTNMQNPDGQAVESSHTGQQLPVASWSAPS